MLVSLSVSLIMWCMIFVDFCDEFVDLLGYLLICLDYCLLTFGKHRNMVVIMY